MVYYKLGMLCELTRCLTRCNIANFAKNHLEIMKTEMGLLNTQDSEPKAS